MTPLLAILGSLSLGAMSRCLIVLDPLKCTSIPCLLHVLLRFSPKPLMYGVTMEMFLFCLLLLLSHCCFVVILSSCCPYCCCV